MGSGASSTAAAAPAKDSKKPVQLLPTHNVQVPSKCARLYFGLSWSAKANIDIDASAVCLAGAQVADIISFQKLRDATPASIVHTGDVLTSGTGTGTSDLERIYVQPELMEKRGVDNIFLVVNVYTQGRTFCDVSSAYARLVHADSDQELARFNLKGCRGDALVFAKFYKHGNKWNWMGLGQQGSGRTAAEVAKALALRMVPVNAPPVQAAAPPPTIVQVLVQPGMPGQNIQVRAPDGRVLSVLVPPSSIPGSVILVNTAPPPQHGVQAKKAPAGGVKVKATKSSAAPALVVASAAGRRGGDCYLRRAQPRAVESGHRSHGSRERGGGPRAAGTTRSGTDDGPVGFRGRRRRPGGRRRERDGRRPDERRRRFVGRVAR